MSIWLQTIFLIVAVISVTGCTDATTEPLDSFQEGDVRADARDIKISKASKVQVRTFIHPKIQKLISNQTADLNASYSNHIATALRKIQRQTGTDNVLYGGIAQLENDGVNIILTQIIMPNQKGEAYKLSVTARQGNYFWERTIERGTNNEHPRFTELAWKNPIEGNRYGEGKLTMEETRFRALEIDRAEILSELTAKLDFGS